MYAFLSAPTNFFALASLMQPVSLACLAAASLSPAEAGAVDGAAAAVAGAAVVGAGGWAFCATAGVPAKANRATQRAIAGSAKRMGLSLETMAVNCSKQGSRRIAFAGQPTDEARMKLA